MARTPEQLDQLLAKMPAAEQDKFLAGLPDDEFQALSDYTKDRYEEGPTTAAPVGEGRYTRRPEEMSNEELQAELGDDIEMGPEITGKPAEPGGFFDTGVGRFATALPKGFAKGMLGLGALPMTAVTGNMDPVVAAMGLVDQGADAVGAPKFDQSNDDRIVNAMAEGMGGAALFPGMGVAVGAGRAAPVARTLATSPVMQAVSGATGGAAGEVSRLRGDDATTQLIASLVGGAAPGGMSSALRRSIRPDASAVRANMENFAAADTTPTVAMATKGGVAGNIEGDLSQSFGGSGPMIRKVNEIEDSVGARLTRRADELGPDMTNREAGQMILDAQPGFKKGASAMVDTAWTNLDKALPKTTRLDMTDFTKFLNDKSAVSALGKHIETNPKLSGDRDFWDSIRQSVEKQLADNFEMTGEGGLPISVVKKVRSQLGDILNGTKNNDVGADIGAVKQAYGLLTEAWKAAADKSPQARKLYDKAMASTKEYHQILDTINPVVEAKGGLLPENVFLAAMPGTKNGPTLIETLMKTLKAPERQALASQFLRRAAKANPSDPEDFNMTTWATNHTRMDGEAKTVLYGPMKDDLDKIAKAVKTVDDEKLKHGLTNVHNPNMGQASRDMVRAAAIGTGAYYFSQHPIIAGLVGGAMAAKPIGSNLLAKFMTSPKTVHWLARNSNLKQNQVPIAINNLLASSRNNSDPEMLELAKALQASQEQE